MFHHFPETLNIILKEEKKQHTHTQNNNNDKHTGWTQKRVKKQQTELYSYESINWYNT